jgi:ketosteroid isomerase-like protein
MSQVNVELAYRVFDAFNRRDLDAYLEFMAPDVETTSRLIGLDGRTYQGIDGARAWWQDLFDIFPDYSAEILDARTVDDFVIVLVRTRGHGHGSGAPVDDTFWQASEWHEGKVAWWQMFATEAQALEAVGQRG